VIGRASISTRKHVQSPVSPDEIQTVSNVTFDASVLQARGPIVVEFMSYGCAHCGAMEPVMQRVAAMLKGTETIVRVNVAVDQDLAQRYQISGTPTVVMFLDGQEVGRIEGPSPSEEDVLVAITQPFAKE
jgi:thioredoxin 1